MAKSIKQIGYTVVEILRNNYIVDDDALPMELVYDMCHDVRSFLVDREYKKFFRLDSAFFTKCNCVKVECKEITCEDLEGNVMQSGIIEKYVHVPFLNNSLGSQAIKYIGGPDLKTPLRYLSTPHGVGGKQTRNAPGYMHIGDKLILQNIDDDELGVLTLIALTKNGSCSLYECDLDLPYNIPENLVHELEGMVLKRLSISLNLKRDTKNNASDGDKS